MVNCVVYGACQMTGRDQAEQIARAKLVRNVFAQYGLKVISPVIEEGVKNEKGPLIQTSKTTLQGFWKRDKEIITYQAHVVFIDEAFRKSIGCEREYSLARGVLWKPVVVLLPSTCPTIADFEDDYVATDLHKAAKFIRDNWGTPLDRIKWRVKMLCKSLPKRLYREVWQWR